MSPASDLQRRQSDNHPSVFISYSWKDSDSALTLVGKLRKAGVNVWLDQSEILPGSHWDTEIESALSNCAVAIVILSPNAVESSRVRDEIAFALERGKGIIPITFQKCEVPLPLIRVQRIDFVNEPDLLARLIKRIQGVSA